MDGCHVISYCREEVWCGEAGGADGYGRGVAVPEARAGGHHHLQLPQQQADLGGGGRRADRHLHLAPADRLHDVVAPGYQAVQP